MKTVWLLMAEYETAEIPLEWVAEKYFGMGKEEAKRKAFKQELPVPVYRAGSRKGGYLVTATVLAAYLDEQKRKASELHAAKKIIAA